MNKKLYILIGLLILIVFLGIMNWLPTNSVDVLTPLNAVINFCSVGCLVACIPLIFCKKKLGEDSLRIDNFSYFSMIFTCGTGVGLLSWAFLEVPRLSEYTDCNGPLGLAISHWTLVPWALFSLFAVFETIDSAYKILPEKVRYLKDIIYSLVMILGIATTYAIGSITLSEQVNSLYGVIIPDYAFLILLGGLTVISVLLGIHKGLKSFSNIVLSAYFLFLILLMIVKPTGLLDSFSLGMKEFIRDFFYNHHYRGSDLQDEWTIFYWIWFTSWIPFTAKFIAQISGGRRVNEIVLSTLILPSILTIIHLVAGYNLSLGIDNINADTVTSLILQKYWYLGVLFIFLMIGFFVTSCDSLTLALDDSIKIRSRYPKGAKKIFWIILVMMITVILMLVGSGGIDTIQGLSFLLSPLIFIVGIVFIWYIIKNRRYIG